MVSVIIPTYNREKTIEKSIRSVLDQTYSELEVIVVDDHSSDNTREVIASINDKRVRYIRLEKNAGACVARNRGLDCAAGEYIAFHDSDDVWFSQKLEKQMAIFSKTEAEVVVCKMHFHDKYNEKVIPAHLKEGYLQSSDNLFGIGTQTIVAKREVFERVRFDETFPRFQDLELLYRLGKQYTIYCIDEGLVDYAVGADSISSNPEKVYIACQLLLKKHPDMKSTRPAMVEQMAHALIKAGHQVRMTGRGDYRKYIAFARECSNSWKIWVKIVLVYAKMYDLWEKYYK